MRRRAQKVTDRVFAAVIRAFMASPRFQGYADATKDGWSRELRRMEAPDMLGAVSTLTLRPSLVQAYLDGMSDLPGKQESAIKVLRAVEKWAIVRDLLPHPVTTGVEIMRSDGGHKPWKDAHVEIAEAHAGRGFSRIVTLAANTGQRGSDIVRMRWTDIQLIEGRPGINVIQKKTGKVLWIPFTRPLIAAMEVWERRPGFIAARPSGVPWTRRGMSSEWAEERRTNPDLATLENEGLVLHGLRATACIRLSRAGATTRQISDWIGMSERMVCRYTRFSEQQENAIAAVIHLDRYMAEKTHPKVIEKK